jgi:hypothetical protein
MLLVYVCGVGGDGIRLFFSRIEKEVSKRYGVEQNVKNKEIMASKEFP